MKNGGASGAWGRDGTALFPLSDNIALGELRAILHAVRHIRESAPHTDLIVLGTDSMNAKAWAQNGYAKSIGANPILRDLDDILGACRLYLVYVNTEENGADAPSRGLSIVDEKVKVSRERLEAGLGLQRGDHFGQ